MSQIVVSESHRRQGIASSLLREVIDQAEREGKSIGLGSTNLDAVSDPSVSKTRGAGQACTARYADSRRSYRTDAFGRRSPYIPTTVSSCCRPAATQELPSSIRMRRKAVSSGWFGIPLSHLCRPSSALGPNMLPTCARSLSNHDPVSPHHAA